MAIPDSYSILLPLLSILKDGKNHSMKEIRKQMALHFNLTDAELRQKKQTGHETLFHNRVHWAKYYLKRAGLITDQEGSTIILTKSGKDIIKSQTDDLNLKYIKNLINSSKNTRNPNLKSFLH